jgi:hypothetical protein
MALPDEAAGSIMGRGERAAKGQGAGGSVVTEEEWLTCNDPQAMIQFLRVKGKKRKLALFGVACCRRISRLCQDERSALAIDVAERYADRQARIDELRMANRQARPPAGDYSRWDRVALDRYLAEHAVLCNAASNALLVSEYALKAAFRQGREKKHQCALLREVFGNPFQRVRIRKAWLTPAVQGLAEVIYDERAFDRFPVLADALEEAGCDNTDLLCHLRGPGPHVRGCFALDTLLAKP